MGSCETSSSCRTWRKYSESTIWRELRSMGHRDRFPLRNLLFSSNPVPPFPKSTTPSPFETFDFDTASACVKQSSDNDVSKWWWTTTSDTTCPSSSTSPARPPPPPNPGKSWSSDWRRLRVRVSRRSSWSESSRPRTNRFVSQLPYLPRSVSTFASSLKLSSTSETTTPRLLPQPPLPAPKVQLTNTIQQRPGRSKWSDKDPTRPSGDSPDPNHRHQTNKGIRQMRADGRM